jgi:hypothetical protein
MKVAITWYKVFFSKKFLGLKKLKPLTVCMSSYVINCSCYIQNCGSFVVPSRQKDRDRIYLPHLSVVRVREVCPTDTGLHLKG